MTFQFLEMQDHVPYLDDKSRENEIVILAPMWIGCAELVRRGETRDLPAEVMMAFAWGALVGLLLKSERLGYLRIGDEMLMAAARRAGTPSRRRARAPTSGPPRVGYVPLRGLHGSCGGERVRGDGSRSDPAGGDRDRGAAGGADVILVDDEDRENEGDLVVAAEKITPEAINFMATHARGLICLSLTSPAVERLGLPMMASNNQSAYHTAFTVSIEAREGVTTGISAADRARTVAVAIDADATPRSVVTPGHVFPLRARDGGVLERGGADRGIGRSRAPRGLDPSGVICEVMNDDGTMARLPDLLAFGAKHRIRLCAVADLIKYRMRNERVVRPEVDGEIAIAGCGTFRTRLYAGLGSGGLHQALWIGELRGDKTLARVQAAPPPWAFLDPSASAQAASAEAALHAIAEAGRGVVVLMHLSAPLDGLRRTFSRDVAGTGTRSPPSSPGPRRCAISAWGARSCAIWACGICRCSPRRAGRSWASRRTGCTSWSACRSSGRCPGGRGDVRGTARRSGRALRGGRGPLQRRDRQAARRGLRRRHAPARHRSGRPRRCRVGARLLRDRPRLPQARRHRPLPRRRRAGGGDPGRDGATTIWSRRPWPRPSRPRRWTRACRSSSAS